MSVEKTRFGCDREGRAVHRFTITNAAGASVALIERGAAIQSLRMPGRDGRMGEVCLGFDSLEGYLNPNGSQGAVVGRVGNRIANGCFTLGGVEYQIPVNASGHALHGGARGFDKRTWTGEALSDAVRMTYVSADGEEGFPGELTARVTYTLTQDNALVLDYEAAATRDTVVNLTNHCYFNLAGSDDVSGHTLAVYAGAITETDGKLIPTGRLKAVAGTLLDLNEPRRLGDVFAAMAQCPVLANAKGYDVNYVLRGEGMRVCAVVCDPESGRKMTVETDQPGVQVYTANNLSITGRGGVRYGAHAALCLETQHFPDSPNHPDFPAITLRAGDLYRTTTVYRFEVA